MQPGHTATTRRRTWPIILAAATFVALIYSARNLVGSVSAGRPVDWVRLVGYEFLYWYIWVAFAPLILWFAGRFQLGLGNWRRVASRLLLLGLLIAPAQAALETAIALSIEFARHGMTEQLSARLHIIGSVILLESFSNVIVYFLIVSGHYAYDYYKKYREREARAWELEGRLAQAELHNLKTQLQPHFLFNTLHTISVLMMRDAGAANRMLIRLSDLLRLSLDSVGTQEVTLKKELEFLRGYLEIEQTRFQDRLVVRLDIDPATLDARVPSLILQPLVENSVRHGIARQPRGGFIEIRSALDRGELNLEVRDNGPGLSAAGPELLQRGVGLSNTRARLQQLYGARQRVEFISPQDGGLLVRLVLPFRNHDGQA
ncbi:MAG TPA: histidine kinase [Pyrinomonadaceae bacterium]|nr:histidine kinase [Pyrinomonadaceae bacterium]